MNLLILVLVLVLPEADICLHLMSDGLGQDPPSMAIQDSIRQGLIVHQALQIAGRRLGAIFTHLTAKLRCEQASDAYQGPLCPSRI